MREIKFEDALDLISEKKWRAALEILQELMREDIQADYLLSMAYCHQQLGDLGQAVQEYQAGLEAEPAATWARINFASTLYRLGEYQESASQWERILAESKTSDTYYQLGLSYSHLGRFPEAEYAFDKAVQLGDQRPEVLYNLGLSRLRSERLNEARDLIRRAAVGGYPPARELLAKLAQ
jgi:tetratricopeptide (TPR) repeat protein